LNLHQLKYWLKKIENTKATSAPSTKWVSVAMDVPSQEINETLQIKVGQTSIEVKPGFNPSFRADVIRALKTLC
jgi:DNA-binding GntR family transcriptional regulator